MELEIIDTNVYFSRWPFRRLPLDEPEKLVNKLRSLGIAKAWVGSLDALLHRDVGAVNARLADDCARYGKGLLIPFGCMNPTLPDWEEELRRCTELHSMRGIRLHPNYHRYGLNDPSCVELLRAASERNVLVQIVVSMEDTRTQNPLCHVAAVDLTELEKQLQDLPKLRVMLLNGFHGSKSHFYGKLAASGRCWFDIATIEGVEGVAKTVAATSADCLVFGSHSPLFYPESGVLKLAESGLPESALTRIRTANAKRAFPS